MDSNFDHLVTIHVPKNGGVTLKTVLQRNYGLDKVFLLKTHDETGINRSSFLKLTQKDTDDYKVLTGHVDFGMHKYSLAVLST